MPDPDRPLILILRTLDDWDDAIRQALRIGFQNVIGYLRGGYLAWAEEGLPTEVGGALEVTELATILERGGPDAPLVIDVRQASEFEAGHLPGAVPIGAGDLPDRLDELPRDRPIATICAGGYRASVGASLIRAAGFENVLWVSGGVPTWQASGFPTEYGLGDTTADWPPVDEPASPTPGAEVHAH